jgi:rhodanese-related sulfurtransferase
MEALEDRSDLLEQTTRITAAALQDLEKAPTVLDVRSKSEWQGGHIPGSINMPLNHLEERASEVPTDGKLVVHCQGGYRSSIAASLLQRLGHKNVTDLVGGYKAWVQSQPAKAAP